MLRIIFCWIALFTTAAHGQPLLVSSLLNHEVLRYDENSGLYTDTIIPAAVADGLDRPHGILERCYDILVASFGSDQVLRYDRFSGAFLGVFIDAPSGIDEPTYIVRGPDNLLYISSQGSDEILRFDDDGNLVDAFVTSGSGGLDGPSGFVFAPDGRLYVAGRYSANLIAYDASTGAFDEVVLDHTNGLGFGNTFGVNLGYSGDLFLASNGRIFRYDIDTAGVVASIPIGFPIGIEQGPTSGVHVASSNNLFVIDEGDNSLAGPFLTGGVINTLNFFRFARSSGLHGCIPPDDDADGDIDAEDFDAFVLCVSGPQIAHAPDCSAKDFDVDGDVDATDYARLQRCYNGADNLTNPTCFE